MRRFVLGVVCLVVLVGGVGSASADTAAQSLPFSQDWTNIGLVTADDDWVGVPGVIGYRGDGLTTVNDVDPQTVTGDGSTTPVDVNANQLNPNTFTTGGVTEFHITNPTIALTGSGTADAPHVVLSLDTTGETGIAVSYVLRDIDGSTDNAVQQVALQFRIGSSGSYTNVAAGYVADATTGPSLATHVTAVNVTLPATADNQPLVQVRVITSNATGNDEWVGVDDISVTSGPPPDLAPSVASTTPAPGTADVSRAANVEITFSEPVSVTGASFAITCATSGTHTFALSGASTTFTLDPDTDFAIGETCTVTVDDQGVTDVDTDDPPNTMAADHTFSFTTLGVFARIFQIQGAAHLSLLNGQVVSGVPGVITAVRPNSFTMQDALGDGNVATSDAILVFGVGGSSVAVGQAVLVSGRVTEFRPGGSASTNLTTTELVSPTVTPAGPGAPIAQTVVGLGGRTPPTAVIDNDATGDVETSGSFDPATDGIDFYESLEAMLLRVNDPVVVGPPNDFGELWVVGDNGAASTVPTVRHGVVISPGDFNPERIQLEDDIVLGATPAANVGDGFTSAAVGVLDYNFGNFELQLTTALTRVDNNLVREVTRPQASDELTIATFNVENLSPVDPPTKFARLAGLIVDNLQAPDIVALEEIQDNDGPANTAVTDASLTLQQLIAAIQAAGGPTYQFRQIDPVDDPDGGQPGGNIRVGFLYRTDGGLAFVDRPGAAPSRRTVSPARTTRRSSCSAPVASTRPTPPGRQVASLWLPSSVTGTRRSS